MAVPVVTCDADHVVNISGGPQTLGLDASGTETPTSWEWTILSYPVGAGAVLNDGDFTAGVASIKAPDIVAPASIDGSYVVQCVATNGEGDSDPTLDRAGGQQNVVVKTQYLELSLPNDFMYDYGQRYLNEAIRKLDSLTPLHVYEEDLDPGSTDGTETEIDLSAHWPPMAEGGRRAGADMDVYRNGVLMRYDTGLSNLMQWKWDSPYSNAKVLFLASGSPGDWYYVRYRSHAT